MARPAVRGTVRGGTGGGARDAHVRDLVAGSEIRFDDRGEFVLKGVRERWELYATSN